MCLQGTECTVGNYDCPKVQKIQSAGTRLVLNLSYYYRFYCKCACMSLFGMSKYQFKAQCTAEFFLAVGLKHIIYVVQICNTASIGSYCPSMILQYVLPYPILQSYSFIEALGRIRLVENQSMKLTINEFLLLTLMPRNCISQACYIRHMSMNYMLQQFVFSFCGCLACCLTAELLSLLEISSTL